MREDSPKDRRDRSGPVFQKLQADRDESEDGEAVHHDGQEEEGLDGERHPAAYLSITWRVSDRRRRDAWGMSETVADAVVSAVRRFVGLPDTRTAKRKSGRKGK